MQGVRPIEVTDIIEGRKVTPQLIVMIGLCLIVVAFDGFNAQIMGYVAPALVKGFHVHRETLGPIISAGLFGLMLGAIGLGTLGDRIGRKTIILIATSVFGVFSLATAFVTSPSQMLALRFITGLGLGGAMPGVIALLCDYVSRRIRATVVTVAVTGFAVGPAIGGFVAGALVHAHGWRIMFEIGGVVPLLMVPVLWLVLPESIRFQLRKGQNAQVAANLRKVYPELSFAADTAFVHAESARPKVPVTDIFTEGRAPGTLLIWAALFLNLIGLNLQTSWLPLIITGLGFPITSAVITTAMFHVGGSIGGFVISRFLDRFDYFKVVGVIFFLAAVMIVLIGMAGHSLLALRATIFGAGLFVVGGQSALNALSGIYYPSHIRSTGSGWALGVGRFGAAVGPIVGATLLGMHLGLGRLFYVEAVPFVLAGVAVSLISLGRGKTSVGARQGALITAAPLSIPE